MPAIDPAALTPRDRYRLGIAAVVPRPIAWITTVSEAGTVNLAPFSYFNGVCSTPLILSVSIAHRVPLKDTLANLRAGGEAVVHLVPPDRLAAMHASSGEYRHEVGEAELLGLELLASERVRPPRLACAQLFLQHQRGWPRGDRLCRTSLSPGRLRIAAGSPRFALRQFRLPRRH